MKGIKTKREIVLNANTESDTCQQQKQNVFQPGKKYFNIK
jgi:hypothetical protein